MPALYHFSLEKDTQSNIGEEIGRNNKSMANLNTATWHDNSLTRTYFHSEHLVDDWRLQSGTLHIHTSSKAQWGIIEAFCACHRLALHTTSFYSNLSSKPQCTRTKSGRAHIRVVSGHALKTPRPGNSCCLISSPQTAETSALMDKILLIKSIYTIYSLTIQCHYSI